MFWRVVWSMWSYVDAKGNILKKPIIVQKMDMHEFKSWDEAYACAVRLGPNDPQKPLLVWRKAGVQSF